MDVRDAITQRRSCRKYLPGPVEWSKIVRILDAGRLAPSSGNLQNWRFIVVASKEKRAKLADLCHEQSWIATAPASIIIASNTAKVTQFYADRGLLYAIMNCAAACENMLLEATNLELGSCWVSSFDDKAIKAEFSVPDENDVFAVITLGYPDEKPDDKHTEGLYPIVFLEKWGGRVRDIDVANKELGASHTAKMKKAKEAIKETAKPYAQHVKDMVKDSFSAAFKKR